MPPHLSRFSLALASSACLFICACSEPAQGSNTQKSEPTSIQATEITIASLTELQLLFDKYQYNNQSWAKGYREIPRITFSGVAQHWVNELKNMPVQTKKWVFFRLMIPLVLLANESIINEREIIKTSALDSLALKKIALKYRLINSATINIDENMRSSLLDRVDILPASLALAQAAEESGWGTSRFAQQGNAFFGQWDFTGNGMLPLAQRQELGNYGVARFASPLASVEAYLLNINTNKAYQKLRILRTQLRSDNKAITGYQLAGALDKYSERGQAYTDGLRAIISYNKLEQVEQAYLADNPLIHLIASDQLTVISY